MRIDHYLNGPVSRRAALDAAMEEADPASLAAGERLRRRFEAADVAWALTQASLRAKAARKFSRAEEMLFTAARFDAARALAVGLLNRVVDDGSALTAALTLAEEMAALSQLTIHASKDIGDGLMRRDLSAETAITWVARANEGPDLIEGMAAFQERRAPHFTWRPTSQ